MEFVDKTEEEKIIDLMVRELEEDNLQPADSEELDAGVWDSFSPEYQE